MDNNNKSNTKTDTPAKEGNAMLDALISRLTEQGKGISSSSTSNLQSSINDAISSTQTSGDLKSQSLQSERMREVSFARDRAGTTYTNAMEGRTGYSTQVAALRELTDTTEKSVRDLDKRYQEAILSNDSATAQRIADLQIKKLEFQQKQEEAFMNNIIQVAGMKQNEDQFILSEENKQKQFMTNLAVSEYQFQRNLGVQFKELDLKQQELNISLERNQIARAEFNAKMSELNRAKTMASITGKVFEDLRKEVMQGRVDPSNLDPYAYAVWAKENYGAQNPDLNFEDLFIAAQTAKADMVTNKITPPELAPVQRTGGLLNGPTMFSGFTSFLSSTATDVKQKLIGVAPGEQEMTFMEALRRANAAMPK